MYTFTYPPNVYIYISIGWICKCIYKCIHFKCIHLHIHPTWLIIPKYLNHSKIIKENIWIMQKHSTQEYLNHAKIFKTFKDLKKLNHAKKFKGQPGGDALWSCYWRVTKYLHLIILIRQKWISQLGWVKNPVPHNLVRRIKSWSSWSYAQDIQNL